MVVAGAIQGKDDGMRTFPRAHSNSVPSPTVAIGFLAAISLVAGLIGCAPGDDGNGGGEGDEDGGGKTGAFERGMRWQITLIEPPSIDEVDLAVDAWDLDLFDTDPAIIDALHENGTLVICYFSAGTFEPGRPDEAAFGADVIGNGYDDEAFAEERYLDVRAGAVLSIMKNRLDLAVDKGCDAVDPDNVDLFDHDTGFDISEAEMADFNRSLIDEAHDRDLAIGLKNDQAQLPVIGAAGPDGYDFAVNEECVRFDECGDYQAFLADGRPVLHIEYEDADNIDAVCAVTRPLGLSTVVKNLALDDAVTFCP